MFCSKGSIWLMHAADKIWKILMYVRVFFEVNNENWSWNRQVKHDPLSSEGDKVMCLTVHSHLSKTSMIRRQILKLP